MTTASLVPRPPWLGRAIAAAVTLNLIGIVGSRGEIASDLLPWLGLACAEGMLLWCVLRPASYDYSAGRALTCLGAALVGAIVAGTNAGTTPSPQSIAHLLWLLGLLVALAILLGVSLWIRLLERGSS